MTLDKRIDILWAMAIGESKEKVQEKYTKYQEAYDNIENRTIRDKIKHRDVFEKYTSYMSKGDKK